MNDTKVEYWNPITALGGAIGDFFIDISPTRPCDKKANNDFSEIQKEKDDATNAGLSPVRILKKVCNKASSKLGEMNKGNDQYYMNWTTDESKSILSGLITETLYIIPNDSKALQNHKELNYFNVFTLDEYNNMDSTYRDKKYLDEAKSFMKTGMDAIHELLKTKHCGTQLSLENKWAKFGLGPQQPFTPRRIGSIAIAAGTLMLMGTAASAAYARIIATGAGQSAAILGGISAGSGMQESGVKTNKEYEEHLAKYASDRNIL